MVYEFKLPDVGEGIAEGEIIKWFVEQSEKVDEEQLIAEIQTDKALIEITSPVSGNVKEILFNEGDVAEVGSVIISFDLEEVNKKEPRKQEEPRRSNNQIATSAKPAEQTIVGKRRVIATPTVRRLARENKIDLQQVKGSGENGRVLKADVENFINHNDSSDEQVEKLVAATAEVNEQEKIVSLNRELEQLVGNGLKEERIPLRGLRRSIAKKMTTSTSTVAHSNIMEEIDVTQLVQLRKEMREYALENDVKLTYLPFVIKAAVSALKKFPYLNSSLDDETEEIILKYQYHIGVATDTEKGLVVPVVKNADEKSLLHMAKEISQLVEKARNQKLSVSEMTGGTFTVTNIGSTGVGLFGTPVVNHPEAAILSIHRIQKKPIVVDDNKIEIRDMLGLSLSFDHRILDGAMAAYFLKQVIQYLENPSTMFLEMI
ncbi:dihydrolipoamide acetyltransferase family protein [Alkalihalobacillus sp. 1P02AB]|uniref:dihydrolipoamide acetyltransferase family protein n=1 Tax=Alkalihalobacillus sp. 1P02AB TaxID=3132260 RepID=UPI0039A5FF5A